MTGSELITKFENMVGDSLDTDFSLQLVNDAKNEIEEDVNPEGIKAVDTSDSTSIGQTYATGINLPDDFYLPAPYIYVGTTPYRQVPFERAVEYRDSNGFYYIDHGSGTYHLCGRQTTVETITFPYSATTDDIGANDSPTWPDRFHRLIPLKMAELYYAIDAGEKARSWDDRWSTQYDIGLKRFKDYTAKLKLAAIDRSAAPIESAAGTGERQINI